MHLSFFSLLSLMQFFRKGGGFLSNMGGGNPQRLRLFFLMFIFWFFNLKIYRFVEVEFYCLSFSLQLGLFFDFKGILACRI